jgi:dipeptidyl aminopeptidase/acylaminoacyl peptidase
MTIRKLALLGTLSVGTIGNAHGAQPFDAAAAFGARPSVSDVSLSVFKAIVAIAAVTDLGALVEDHRRLCDFAIISEEVGDGPTIRQGSPAEHADKIKVPVLLFHGAHDGNVSIEQSTRMASSLAAAGVKSELVTWDQLDHYLDDSAAREKMLRKSDEWLRLAFGMPAVTAELR